VRAFGLHDGECLVAYGELGVDDDEAEVERATSRLGPGRPQIQPRRRNTTYNDMLVMSMSPSAKG
jgi:hypothetical protein